jgi:hypothetical protein
MRILIALLACTLILAGGMQGPAKAGSVAGTWTGTVDYTGPGGETQSGGAWCLFKQDGENVTGTAGPDEGQQVPVLDGKLVGDRLTFRVEVPNDSGPALVYKLECKLVSPDRIEGNLTADHPEAGRITGKLVITKKS